MFSYQHISSIPDKYEDSNDIKDEQFNNKFAKIKVCLLPWLKWTTYF